jgi:hypothetical protein
MKKGARESYAIKMFKPDTNAKGMFWCSCPDHAFNSSKKKIVCKHICFIVCKVGKIFDPAYFESKQLTHVQFQDILDKVDNPALLMRDLNICRPSLDTTKLLFTQKTKAITDEDVCPICYDDFKCHTMDENPNDCSVLSCPNCLNYVHRECIKVWMEKQKTCIYCRSNVWEHYVD